MYSTLLLLQSISPAEKEALSLALLLGTLFILVFIVPCVILGFVMNKLSGKVELTARKVMGSKVYYILFGWFGTLVHEGSHVVLCFIFGHEIRDIKWFDWNPNASTLGFVRHAYNPANPWHLLGLFFIGIGPIIVGGTIITLVALYLVGFNLDIFSPATLATLDGVSSYESALVSVKLAWQDLSLWAGTTTAFSDPNPWQWALFLYMAFAIGSSVRLSRADLDEVLKGMPILIFLFIALSLVLAYYNILITQVLSRLVKAAIFFYAMMIFAIAVNLLALAALHFEHKTRM